jgi:Tol biopolymer transport system component
MHIAFDTRPEGQADIYVISSYGGTPRRLTHADSEDVVPSWSKDGAWIYFASNRTGVWQIWRAQTSGGGEEQVTRSGGFGALESPDGRYLYYAQGRSAAGLWRKSLPAGPEELVLDRLKPGYWGYWAVVENGIYFADQPDPGGPRGIYFQDFAGRRIRRVAEVEHPFAVTDSAFAVSPDRRYLLYTQVDQSGSDILMLDHYR